jgi:predicted anti-sigma-YlaC factor YlaD
MGWKLSTNAVIGLLIVLTFMTGCSIKKMAMNQVANALTGADSGTVFTGDNDPELVGDALPFAIKMYESLLASNPNHQGLQLTTGSLYIMYANAFLHTPASMMTDEQFHQQEFLMQRAKNLYIRGRDILVNALDKKYPGFRQKIDKRKFSEAVAMATIKDIEMLYWAGAGWMGAFAIDPFDMKLGITLPGAAAMMERVMNMNPNYGLGDIHNFYVLYYGSLPDYMGGSFEKARKHFDLAVKASKDKGTSPYISLATTVSIQDQKVDEFKTLLEKVVKFDPNSDPANRLLNTINIRKARWLLNHVDDFFLPKEVPGEGEAETDKNKAQKGLKKNM